MQYRAQDMTFAQAKVADAKRRIDIEVGDSKSSDMFYPQFKTMHWNNETNFSVRLIDEDYASAETKIVDDKIEWKRGDRIARFYDKDDVAEDGGFEFEVEFATQPVSNAVSFSIQTKGLSFYKQPKPPELSERSKIRGLKQRDDIEGSYAVYHKTKRGNYLDKEYLTGKAFHIYRPWAEDVNGVRVWCELNIDEVSGEMTITVPQDFLDNAIYPVLVDPTFGFTSVGGTTDNSAFGARISSKYSTLVDGGAIQSITVHSSVFESSSGAYRYAIYDSSGNKVAQTAVQTAASDGLPDTPSWRTINTETNPVLAASTEYTLTFGLNENMDFAYYDEVGGSPNQSARVSGEYIAGSDFTDVPMPDPLTDPFNDPTYNDAQYSIYATYSNVAPPTQNSNFLAFF